MSEKKVTAKKPDKTLDYYNTWAQTHKPQKTDIERLKKIVNKLKKKD